MSEIPHPFIIESINLLDNIDKSGVHFIHINHSNPALNSNSDAFKNIINNGFGVAKRGQIFDL